MLEEITCYSYFKDLLREKIFTTGTFNKKGPILSLMSKLNIIMNKTPVKYDILLQQAEVEVWDLKKEDMDEYMKPGNKKENCILENNAHKAV